MQTIKAVARRRWPADHEGARYSWYEPLRDDAAIGRAVRWVLGHPQLFLNSSSDATLLETILAGRRVRGDRRRPTTSCRPTSTRSACSRCSTGASSNASDSTHDVTGGTTCTTATSGGPA